MSKVDQLAAEVAELVESRRNPQLAISLLAEIRRLAMTSRADTEEIRRLMTEARLGKE